MSDPDSDPIVERIAEEAGTYYADPAFKRAARDIIAALEARLAEAQKDAERWRGLLGCDRIRVIGCSGFNDPKANFKHLGLELWTRHPEPSGEYAQTMLCAFADAARSTDNSRGEPT